MAIEPSEFLHAPTGGTPVPGGATFRVWAPRAKAVHVSGDFNGGRTTAARGWRRSAAGTGPALCQA